MAKKTYVGNGRKRSDTWLKVSLCVDDLLQFAKVSQKNGKKYVNVDINVKDAPDQYNNDVSVSIDDYDPKQKASAPQPPSATTAPKEDIADDLPF